MSTIDLIAKPNLIEAKPATIETVERVEFASAGAVRKTGTRKTSKRGR